ncbi:MAG: hypothetical protein ACRCXZ_06705 [Patescibacteria group bacterium]
MISRHPDGRPMTIAETLANFKPAKNLKNGRQRELEELVTGRIDTLSRVADNLDMNDTDVVMIAIILSKTSFNTFRMKAYRVAKKMGIQTGAKPNKKPQIEEYFDDDLTDEDFDPKKWDSI